MEKEPQPYLTPIILKLPSDLGSNLTEQQAQVTICLKEQAASFNWQNTVTPIFINANLEPITIEMVRDLISSTSYSVSERQHKVFVLANLDQASLPAQQALLKILEEPPKRTLFVLTTSQLNKVLPTIQSRCLIKAWPGKIPHTPATINPNLQPHDPRQEQTDQAYQSLLSFFDQPSQHRYGQLSNLAEQYKEKQTAISLLEKILQNRYHYLQLEVTAAKIKSAAQQQSLTTSQLVTQSKIVLNALQLLEKQVNVTLALEHCLFEVKSASQQN